MIIIKNYYDQQQELSIAKYRLNTLEGKKKIYFNATQPKAVVVKETVVLSTVHADMMTEYTAKIEDIDKKIAILTQEIVLLEQNLSKMEECIRNIKGSLETVFVAKYIDGLKVKQIAKKTDYSESHVYKILSDIREIIKDNKK